MGDRKIKIYCGRRFYFDYKVEGYINQAADGYRAILLGEVSKLLHAQEACVINDRTEYLGPFYHL